jgi:plastocyanin
MKPIRITLLAVAASAMLAACGATTADPGSDPNPASADATVTASDMAFAPGTVTVSGGQTVTIALVNEDAMPHNIAIYRDETKAEKLFEGELVTETTVVYEISGLDPGEYFFDCSLHPEMTGTLVVEG